MEATTNVVKMNAGPHYLPTPAQIAEACKAIQATWTPLERRQRMYGDWSPGRPRLALKGGRR
ncbi:hypothetical protein GC163_21120 [bacterium]|nr:hypothetical protein [bacterium]